jgi:hypothetical protein
VIDVRNLVLRQSMLELDGVEMISGLIHGRLDVAELAGDDL